MPITYFILFLMSLAFNLYALEVVIMDYDDLEPGRIYAYDLRPKEKECFCYDKY